MEQEEKYWVRLRMEGDRAGGSEESGVLLRLFQTWRVSRKAVLMQSCRTKAETWATTTNHSCYGRLQRADIAGRGEA